MNKIMQIDLGQIDITYQADIYRIACLKMLLLCSRPLHVGHCLKKSCLIYFLISLV